MRSEVYLRECGWKLMRKEGKMGNGGGFYRKGGGRK